MDDRLLGIDVGDKPVDDLCVPTFSWTVKSDSELLYQVCWLSVSGMSTGRPRDCMAPENHHYGPCCTSSSMLA